MTAQAFDYSAEPLAPQPCSIPAEQSVLGGLMIDNSTWGLVSERLNAGDFYRRQHQVIFSGIGQLAENKAPFDIVTLSDALKELGELDNIGGLPYLIVLAKDTPSVVNIGAYSDIVKEKSRLRQIISLGTSLTAKAFSPEGLGSGEILESAKSKLSDIKPSTSSHSQILDSGEHHCVVDFLSHVDDSHILKRLSLSIAAATDLPAHTVFLIGLGVFSAAACRVWDVAYRTGGTLPIGMYVVAEQPPGTAKSRCLTVFQYPFFEAERSERKRRDELNPLSEEAKALKDKRQIPIFTTNSTPEKMEEDLNDSGGFFAGVSSEQGLFNALLGLSYGDVKKANNNDLLLSGFDGGYISSARISRAGYFGHVVGSAVLFAQQGSIEKLLGQSNGTGLAERFLMIAEPHSLGQRDFSKMLPISSDLIEIYGMVCSRFSEGLFTADVQKLETLHISPEGYAAIAEYRQKIEPFLVDGGKFSHVSIRGASAKIDMQIMKISANLYKMSGGSNKTIDDSCVYAAIGIADALLNANLKLCIDKGISGRKAEYSAILSLYEMNPRVRTERDIIQSRSRASPFKEMTGNKSDAIRETLNEMVREGVLKIALKDSDRKSVKGYLLNQ